MAVGARFDRDNNRQFLCNIPFADHNAMIDPSTADVTARVVECLGRFGWPADHPVIEQGRAISDERPDRRWIVVRALGRELCVRHQRRVAGAGNGFADRAGILRARRGLAAASAEGRRRAFGESLNSYEMVSTKGQGNSTPSQTAWGLIGLLAERIRTIRRLSGGGSIWSSQQNANGSWSEEDFTGTGFPGVFYLKYHLYKNSFPVYALARYRNQAQRSRRNIAR